MGTLTIKATVKASYKVVTPGFLLTSRTKHLQASSGDCRSQCSCWHDPRSNTCAWKIRKSTTRRTRRRNATRWPTTVGPST